jgi:hypothetical protein
MSAAERLASLKAKDEVAGSRLLKGTDALVVATARSVSDAGAVTLDLTFMGVKLATAGGKVQPGDKISWWEAN